MNLLNKSFLTLGLITATVAPAAAEFAESAGDAGPTAAIELASSDNLPDHLSKMLDANFPAGLSESVLARHLRAAMPANGPQAAGGGGMGGETPHLVGDNNAIAFNSLHPGNRTTPFGDSIAAAGGTLSLAGTATIAATHNVGSGYVTGAAPQVVASSSAAISAGIITTQANTVISGPGDKNPVPLPPAALLFASGLFGLPLTRRLTNRKG